MTDTNITPERMREIRERTKLMFDTLMGILCDRKPWALHIPVQPNDPDVLVADVSNFVNDLLSDHDTLVADNVALLNLIERCVARHQAGNNTAILDDIAQGIFEQPHPGAALLTRHTEELAAKDAAFKAALTHAEAMELSALRERDEARREIARLREGVEKIAAWELNPFDRGDGNDTAMQEFAKELLNAK